MSRYTDVSKLVEPESAHEAQAVLVAIITEANGFGVIMPMARDAQLATLEFILKCPASREVQVWAHRAYNDVYEARNAK